MTDLALTDHHAIALTLWGEARGEPIEGKIAVANIIRNRLKSGKWGDSYREVCLWPWQFSCWKKEGGESNYHAVQRLAGELINNQTPEDNVLRECIWIAHGMTGEWIQDNIKGATHYHVSTMNPKPFWAIGKTPVVSLHSHDFYRGIK